jgi:hypothetical protein
LRAMKKKKKTELPCQRNQKAIVDRFAKIKKATSQFAGVVARNKIKSGEDKDLHMARCVQVFEETHKAKFPWMECFEILEKQPGTPKLIPVHRLLPW